MRKSPKTIVRVLLATAIFSCAISIFAQGTDNRKQNGSAVSSFDTRPLKADQIIILGTAARLSTPEKSIQAALEDAAKKVSMFQGISGEVNTLLTEGSGYLDFSSYKDVAIAYDTGFQKHIAALQYDSAKDVSIIENCYFVRVRYNIEKPVIITHKTTVTANQPDWVTNPPGEISGFMTAVGHANRQRLLSNTIMKSYENAIANMLAQINTEVRRAVSSNEKTTGATVGAENIFVSNGSLTGFLVIDTWINPKDKSVWTLAIANKQ